MFDIWKENWIRTKTWNIYFFISLSCIKAFNWWISVTCFLKRSDGFLSCDKTLSELIKCRLNDIVFQPVQAFSLSGCVASHGVQWQVNNLGLWKKCWPRSITCDPDDLWMSPKLLDLTLSSESFGCVYTWTHSYLVGTESPWIHFGNKFEQQSETSVTTSTRCSLFCCQYSHSNMKFNGSEWGQSLSFQTQSRVNL